MCLRTVCHFPTYMRHCMFCTLERKCRYFVEIVVISYSRNCQNDNFRCRHLWKFRQNNISVLVFASNFRLYTQRVTWMWRSFGVFQGWGSLSQYPSVIFHFFLQNYQKNCYLFINYRPYIWHVSWELGWSDNRQIWMWFRGPNLHKIR